MDSRRRQRSIALNHIPPLPIPHGLEYPLGSRMYLFFGPSAAGGLGATVSTFPRVLLTREPTCTQAIDLGASDSTRTPADTSGPSRSSGHFPNFPWPGCPWLAHGSPLHGDWFSNPTGLLLGAFGLPPRSPLPHPVTGPIPASLSFPIPKL